MKKLPNGDWEIAKVWENKEELFTKTIIVTRDYKNTWNKIENLPINNHTILMYLNDGTRRIGSYSEGSYILWTYRSDDDKWLERIKPTHWMYLPEGPKED